MADDLNTQARQFAADTSDLLNRTVAHGVRITALSTPDGRTIMGSGVKKTQIIPDPIPIAPAGGKALVFLFLVHSYELDPEGVYLTLEDLIEFMVVEEMVVPRPQWRKADEEHHASWTTIQVKAAVRRNQDDAAAALRESGWTVTDPPSETS